MASETATEPTAGADTETPEGAFGITKFLRDIKTVPNMLSISRIFITLAAGALYLGNYKVHGLLLGAFAGVTDILDGWLARKLNQTTELGAILDRLSDLVLETVAFACLLHFRLVPPVFIIVYLLREYVIISARQYVATQGKIIPSSFLGKLKTDLVLISLLGLFAAHSGLISNTEGNDIVYKIGYGMMIAGLVCSYVSAVLYLRIFMRIYSAEK